MCTARLQNRQRPVTSHLSPSSDGRVHCSYPVLVSLLYVQCVGGRLLLFLAHKPLDQEEAPWDLLLVAFCRSWRRMVSITACEHLWPESGLWFTDCKTDSNSLCIPVSPVWTGRLHPSRRGVYFPNPGGQVVTTPGTSCSR